MFKDRWTLANTLPLAFVVWVISSIWSVYIFLHLKPLLDLDWARFKVQAGVSQTCTALLCICFFRAVWTDPGTVPDTPEWQETTGKKEAKDNKKKVISIETKQTGDRRLCKWCNHYKPDRCHHCRVCNSCVLRMDHHCPWIVNCVGFRNHKFFFLLVFYALTSCLYIVVTMSESVNRIFTEYTTADTRFFLVFGMTFGIIMLVLLASFFSLHVWLLLTATTTIEFCEKRVRQNKTPDYRQGTYQDFKNVLGPWPVLWLLPIMPPDGDGLFFQAVGVVQKDAAATQTDANVASGGKDSFNGSAPLSKKDTAFSAAAADTTDGSGAPEVTGEANKASTA